MPVTHESFCSPRPSASASPYTVYRRARCPPAAAAHTPLSSRKRDDVCFVVAARALSTIKDVGDACGLPQPVVAQLVPRTWIDDAGGWMYTAEQLAFAVQIAPAVRDGSYAGPPQPS